MTVKEGATCPVSGAKAAGSPAPTGPNVNPAGIREEGKGLAAGVAFPAPPAVVAAAVAKTLDTTADATPLRPAEPARQASRRSKLGMVVPEAPASA
mmetsp:Transcript_18986/g.53387  ORF Transcript_18986/g.53387 Transcript_18986/m.53387 type:complete len:96 (+) Transcript_18986:234-521(+)